MDAAAVCWLPKLVASSLGSTLELQSAKKVSRLVSSS